jgi:hypothetical protein
MGVFLRKSFSAGPIRFNLSKSGIGMSAGVKGLRYSVGPRGVGVSAGRKGVYFRKTLSSGSTARSTPSAFAKTTNRSVEPAVPTPKEKWDAYQSKKAESPLNPGGYPLAIGLGIVALFSLFITVVFAVISLSAGAFGMFWTVIWSLLAALAYWRKSEKIKRFKRHETALSNLTTTEDLEKLKELRTSFVGLSKTEWEGRHRFIYSRLFEVALEDGIDASEMALLKEVSKILWVNPHLVHEAKIKERMWECMADGTVTKEEEGAINQLLEICEIPADKLKAETSALQQFVAVRPIQHGNLPSIESDISLQRGELCHHQTSGSLLEKKILRSYTVDGEKHKEEGLTVNKEGRIYITSKRVLIVGDGTTSIPHSKILDAEIDPDNDVISITKDGRQKPLFLRVPDLIYTGVVLEAASTSPDLD